jgi:energy-coupling factor transport system permease protein
MSSALVWGRPQAAPGPFTLLDPRTRLLLLLVPLVGIPFLHGLPVLAGLCLASPLAARTVRLPAGFTSGMLRLALLPLVFTLLLNALYAPGSSWVPHPGLGGVRAGAIHACQFWLTWLAFSLFWATTSPDELVRSLRGGPRRETGRLEDLRLTVELALRMAPLVGEEAERLVLAQKSRGRGPGASATLRASQSLRLLVPLVLGALRRAEALADTLVARGFGSGPATRYREYRWPAREALLPLGAAAILALLSRVP